MKNWFFVFVFLLANDVCAFQTIYLVRHAEKFDNSKDPQLSLKGQKRALDLALHLRDASVRAIFVTEYQRTQKTAEPLAELIKVQPRIIGGAELAQLVEQLHLDTGSGAALVVGHSNTVPALLKALGGTVKWVIAEDEFDRLVIVTPIKSAEPVVSILRY